VLYRVVALPLNPL